MDVNIKVEDKRVIAVIVRNY